MQQSTIYTVLQVVLLLFREWVPLFWNVQELHHSSTCARKGAFSSLNGNNSGLLVRKCTLSTGSCFSLSVIQVRNALKDFTHMLSRNSPCVGTFSVIIYEAVNASGYCLLFTKAKVQIGDSKMGAEGLQGVSRTSQHSVTVISVYLFIELINCSPHQSPLDRKAGDNSAPLLMQGVTLPVMDQVTVNQWARPLKVNIIRRWAINWKSISLMDQQRGQRQQNPLWWISLFQFSNWEPPRVICCWGVTMKKATGTKTFSGLTSSGKVWSLAHKFSLASTVLQAYCWSLKTIEN